MAVDTTLDLDQLEQLSTIYNNLINRDRAGPREIEALDLLADLVYNEVLKHHDIIYPPTEETTTEPQPNEDE